MEGEDESQTSRLFSQLLKQIPWQHKSIVKKAFLLAQDAHRYQKRDSGEPYIIHPLSVAIILTEFSKDPEVIEAALLHDVLEDTDVSPETLKTTFGEKVYHLVNGVTKISRMKNESATVMLISNLRKMIQATVEDQRTLVIKIADRLHNMQTLQALPEDKQKRIAFETIKIYAPLAGRVGIYKIKSELEDLCLRYLDFEEYKKIRMLVDEKKADRDAYIQRVVREVEEHLKAAKIRATVDGRSKHFYSIYRKIKEKGRSFSEVYDLYAIRIITWNLNDCYTAMGIIHGAYEHIPGRFKDYINHRKKNGYQSLHTTVTGPEKRNIEVQIRTRAMHMVAEYGIAAHWRYKEAKKLASDLRLEIPGKAILKEMNESLEMEDETNEDIYQEIVEGLEEQERDDIFVFTPRGEIHFFPKNSTILDFAFRIHSDLGLHCSGARIDNRHVSIRAYLRNGEKIQITTNPNAHPNSDWLRYVVTAHAKNRIRNYLRRMVGSYPLVPEVPLPEEGKENKSTPVSKIDHKKKKQKEEEKVPVGESLVDSIVWEGEKTVKKKIAKCCQPVYGKPIVGYITRLDGITVHDAECKIIRKMMDSPEKKDLIIQLSWEGVSGYITELEVHGNDRGHLYYDIIKAFDYFGVDILEASAKTTAGRVDDKFKLNVDSREQLDNILARMKSIPGIETVAVLCFRRKRCSE